MSEFCHVPPKPTVYHQAGRVCTYTEGREVEDGTAGLARLCAECALAMVKHDFGSWASPLQAPLTLRF